MSRVEKFGRGRKAKRDLSISEVKKPELELPNELMQDHPEDGLPARRHIHPSNKQQMTKWFYRLLIILFISLLGGLLLWGRNYEKF